MRGVVVSDVVNVGRFGEELGAIGHVHANGERVRFSGAVDGDAGEKLSADFEGGRAVRGAVLDAGKFVGDFADGGEGQGMFAHVLEIVFTPVPEKTTADFSVSSARIAADVGVADLS